MSQTTTDIGRRAERLVARMLQAKHYKVVAMNWRTRSCEIDIVAFKNDCVYFIEVKYRNSALYGSGLSYITNAKLQQMHYAARLWAAKYRWEGTVMLCAAQVNRQGTITMVEITS